MLRQSSAIQQRDDTSESRRSSAGTTNANFRPLVDNGKIVSLRCNVREPTTSRVIETLPCVSKNPKEGRHRSFLVSWSREAVREAPGGESDSSFRLNVICPTYRCDVRAGGREDW